MENDPGGGGGRVGMVGMVIKTEFSEDDCSRSTD